MYKIEFFNKTENNLVWSQEYEKEEIVIGMLSVAFPICNELNEKSNYEYYFKSNANLVTYRKISNRSQKQVDDGDYLNIIPDDYYGLWVRSSRAGCYNFFIFQTNYFFQGLISLARHFEVDFRNYIYRLPFNNQGQQFALEGYSMTYRKIVIPDDTQFDIEDLEEDDENINSIFERTDDIITIFDDKLNSVY